MSTHDTQWPNAAKLAAENAKLRRLIASFDPPDREIMVGHLAHIAEHCNLEPADRERIRQAASILAKLGPMS